MSNDTILQNLEYVVLKDQPTINSYGQYIFDLYNIGNQFPGQSDGDSDYFTNQDNIHNPNSYKLRTEIAQEKKHTSKNKIRDNFRSSKKRKPRRRKR